MQVSSVDQNFGHFVQDLNVAQPKKVRFLHDPVHMVFQITCFDAFREVAETRREEAQRRPSLALVPQSSSSSKGLFDFLQFCSAWLKVNQDMPSFLEDALNKLTPC